MDILEDEGVCGIQTFADEKSLIDALCAGKILAAVVGTVSADMYQKENPTIKRVEVDLGKPWGKGAGVCIKKERTDLSEKVSKAIAELKQEGVIADLQRKWFGRVLD